MSSNLRENFNARAKWGVAVRVISASNRLRSGAAKSAAAAGTDGTAGAAGGAAGGAVPPPLPASSVGAGAAVPTIFTVDAEAVGGGNGAKEGNITPLSDTDDERHDYFSASEMASIAPNSPMTGHFPRQSIDASSLGPDLGAPVAESVATQHQQGAKVSPDGAHAEQGANAPPERTKTGLLSVMDRLKIF